MNVRNRLRLGGALLALLLALLVAGCGDDDDSSTAAAPGDGPERVVTLDFPSTDAVLALGTTPVAMAKVTYVPGDVQAWTKAALRGASPELLDTDKAIPLEKVAAARPDLIVATNAYNAPQVLSKLRAIAPVVSWKEGPGVDTWQQSTLAVGRALKAEDEARKLVADTEARVRAAAAEHPAFKDKTVTLFNYVGGQSYAISSPKDFSIRFLSTLGFELPEAIASRDGKKSAGGTDGRVAVSRERLPLLDADVVMGTTSESTKALDTLVRSPLFQRLPAVKRKAYATLGIGPATSIAFPSVLSVNYALRTLVPVLDRLTAESH